MKASLSSIVYDLAINGKINEPLSQEMMDCFRKLAGMANNLNQLAHEAHIAGYEDVAAADRLLSEKIDEVLNKFLQIVRIMREIFYFGNNTTENGGDLDVEEQTEPEQESSESKQSLEQRKRMP